MKVNLEKVTLVELIEEVLKDKNSKILWKNENYRRITRKANSVEEEYKFNYKDNTYGEVTSVKLGNSKLNVNLKVKYNGEVINNISKLKMDAVIYKDYCVVKNGKLNVETLPMILSKPLRLRLKKLGCISSEDIVNDKKITIINLKALEILNNKVIDKVNVEDLINTMYEIEVIKVQKSILNKILKEFLENSSIFENEKYNTLERQYQKMFGINEKGIYSSYNVEFKEEIIQDMYVANICEWKIEKFPKKMYEDKFTNIYNSYITQNEEETYDILTNILNTLEDLQSNLQKQVNKIKIYSIISNKNVFNWEEKLEKEKKAFDKDLKLNLVVGDKVEISKVRVNDIIIRQDKYLKLVKH